MRKRKKANLDVRARIVASGFRHYEIAKEMNLLENKFSELLRWELEQEKKDEIERAIQNLLQKEHDKHEKAN